MALPADTEVAEPKSMTLTRYGHLQGALLTAEREGEMGHYLA